MSRSHRTDLIGDKLAALENFTTEATGLVDRELLGEGEALFERASTRLRHGTGHVVVALAGPTGAGKSSLFNSIVGQDVAAVDVRRPTTSVTQAAIFGDQADALLDWLGIARRHYFQSSASPSSSPASNDSGPTTESTGSVVSDRPGLDGDIEPSDDAGSAWGFVDELEGLVLVDLPDYDSVELANRSEVDRLVAQVDALIWVVDPQKYADDALHRGYLQPLAAYGDVMRFVLSKVDTLDEAAKANCIADLARLVAADGIDNPSVLGISVTTGEGLGAFAGELRSIAAEKAQVVDRVRADLHTYASKVPALAAANTNRDNKAANSELVRALAVAAGANEVAQGVRDRYKQKATRAIGWPPVRLWARRRVPTELAMVPAGVTATTQPQVRLALRNYGDAIGAGLNEPVASAVRAEAIGSEAETVEGLDNLGYGLRDELRAPRWWSLAGALQWLAFGVAVAGLVWLILLFFVESFLRIRVADYTPNFRDAPLPTWLLLGGLVAGLVLTLLFRILVAVSGRRRARRSKSYVEQQARDVAELVPIEHVSNLTRRANSCDDLVAAFA